MKNIFQDCSCGKNQQQQQQKYQFASKAHTTKYPMLSLNLNLTKQLRDLFTHMLTEEHKIGLINLKKALEMNLRESQETLNYFQ